MFAPLHDELESATMVAQWSREALSRIREKMMTQQKGEAFYDIGPPGSMEIPAFLRRHKDDPPDTTPMPKWITEANAAAHKRKVGDDKKEVAPHVQAILDAAEAEHAMLTAGKKLAKKEQREAAEDRVEKRYRAKTRAKPKEDTGPEQEWDSGAARWRPVGYMSPARYRWLLAGMPSDAHRKVFVEMYGHTQKVEDREPSNQSLAATRRKVHAAFKPGPKGVPVKDTPKKAAAPAGATPGRERKLNPEHDAKVSAMLLRPEGATLGEIGAAMGWQEHSASAFLSGIRKTRAIVKTVEARGNVYRLEQKQ